MKWLQKNAFWILSVFAALLCWTSISEENGLALLASVLLLTISVICGIYYYNVEFTRALLDEYDASVKVQSKRRGLKVIKGGKRNAKNTTP